MRVYTHGGQLGDLVYSIPAFRESGCGTFGIVPGVRGRPWWVDVPVVQPLLRSQGFDVVEFRSGGIVQAGRGWVDGDRFRGGRGRWGRAPSGRKFNIAERHCLEGGFDVAAAGRAWLALPPWRVAEVVIVRSPRYRPEFRRLDWRALACGSAGRSCFLGLVSEHLAFESEFDVRVRHVPTSDFLEAGRVMAGADLVAANQTGLAAVAMGLGLPLALERCERMDDCGFEFCAVDLVAGLYPIR